MWTIEGGALVWLVLAIVAGIVEVSIPHFGLIFVSLASVAAAAAAALGFGLTPQLLLFTVTLVAALALLRPLFVRKLHGPGVPGRTEALVGRDGVVTEEIDPVRGTGRVNVGGQDWAARSAATVPTGTLIRVVGADGIVLEVTRP
jgi:membrane protein implicated in regulation of membrane protease activity